MFCLLLVGNMVGSLYAGRHVLGILNYPYFISKLFRLEKWWWLVRVETPRLDVADRVLTRGVTYSAFSNGGEAAFFNRKLCNIVHKMTDCSPGKPLQSQDAFHHMSVLALG
jgi:hypothetical protein